MVVHVAMKHEVAREISPSTAKSQRFCSSRQAGAGAGGLNSALRTCEMNSSGSAEFYAVNYGGSAGFHGGSAEFHGGSADFYRGSAEFHRGP